MRMKSILLMKKIQVIQNDKLNLNDLSAPPGVKINDPVRMYLKK